MFWVISVYFNLRNTLPKFGTFLLGHPVYIQGDSGGICITLGNDSMSDSKQKSSYEHGYVYIYIHTYSHEHNNITIIGDI